MKTLFDILVDLLTGDFFQLMLKGSLIIILFVIGLIVGIVKLIQFNIRQKGLNKVMSKAKASVVDASDIIDGLDFCYGSFSIVDYQTTLIQVKQKLPGCHLGTFKILEVIEADPCRFLCPTNKEIVAYREYSNQALLAGNELMLFAIVINQDKSQIEVYSEAFDDLNDKTTKTKFKTELRNYFDSLKTTP